MNHKLASNPVISHVQYAAERFSKACRLQDAKRIPSLQPPATCPDIELAVWATIRQSAAISETRAATASAVTELAVRRKYLTDHLRQFQPPSVAQVTASINLGLVCLLAVVMQWPDIHLPRRMVLGFATPGTLEDTSLFATLPE